MRAAGMCTSKTEQCVRICCVLRTTTLAVDSKFFSAFLTWPTAVPTATDHSQRMSSFMILGADRATFGVNDDELRGYMLRSPFSVPHFPVDKSSTICAMAPDVLQIHFRVSPPIALAVPNSVCIVITKNTLQFYVFLRQQQEF